MGEHVATVSSGLEEKVIDVETGAPSAVPFCDPAQGCDDPSIVVTVDNPSLASLLPLVRVNTNWSGPNVLRPQQQLVSTITDGFGGATEAVQNYNGDFEFVAGRGDAQQLGQGEGDPLPDGLAFFPPANDPRSPVAAVRERFLGRANEPGNYVAPDLLPLFGRGLRVGYRPMTAELEVTEPQYGVSQGAQRVRVALHPSVSLIPVQVAVMFSRDIPMENVPGYNMWAASLGFQLALWDQVQTVETTNFSSNGELTEVQRVFVDNVGLTTGSINSWSSPSGDGLYRVASQVTPDSAWGVCGIQFRLVHYFEVETDFQHVFPRRGPGLEWPSNTDDKQPCRDNLSQVFNDPRYIPDVPLLVFMYRPTFEGTGTAGVTLYTPTTGSCVTMLPQPEAGDAVIAHELGHQAGALNHPPNSSCHLMCQEGALGPALPSECSYLHRTIPARGQTWTQWKSARWMRP